MRDFHPRIPDTAIFHAKTLGKSNEQSTAELTGIFINAKSVYDVEHNQMKPFPFSAIPEQCDDIPTSPSCAGIMVSQIVN